MAIAKNAKYRSYDGSGQRNSTRFCFGSDEHIGIRQQALQLRCEFARLTGASKPGTRRLYKLVVGAKKAINALAAMLENATDCMQSHVTQSRIAVVIEYRFVHEGNGLLISHSCVLK